MKLIPSVMGLVFMIGGVLPLISDFDVHFIVPYLFALVFFTTGGYLVWYGMKDLLVSKTVSVDENTCTIHRKGIFSSSTETIPLNEIEEVSIPWSGSLMNATYYGLTIVRKEGEQYQFHFLTSNRSALEYIQKQFE